MNITLKARISVSFDHIFVHNKITILKNIASKRPLFLCLSAFSSPSFLSKLNKQHQQRRPVFFIMLSNHNSTLFVVRLYLTYTSACDIKVVIFYQVKLLLK